MFFCVCLFHCIFVPFPAFLVSSCTFSLHRLRAANSKIHTSAHFSAFGAFAAFCERSAFSLFLSFLKGKNRINAKKALDKSFPSRYTCCQQQGRCEMNFIRSRSCPFLRKCEKNAFYEERDGKQSRFPPLLECFQERNDFGGGIPDGQHRRAFRQQRFQ